MTFVTVTKAHSVGFTADSIRMGWSKQNTETTRSVYVAVAREILNQLGWTLHPATATREFYRVGIREGIDVDAGFLMLVEDPSGYSLGSYSKTGKSVACTMNVSMTAFRHYVLNGTDNEVTAHEVDYSIDMQARTILIECPDWLRFDPQTTSTRVEQVEPPPPRVPNRHERREQAKLWRISPPGNERAAGS